MVQRCIKCRKIVDSTRLYCRACETKIKQKNEIKKVKQKAWENADFFERQRMK